MKTAIIFSGLLVLLPFGWIFYKVTFHGNTAINESKNELENLATNSDVFSEEGELNRTTTVASSSISIFNGVSVYNHKAVGVIGLLGVLLVYSSLLFITLRPTKDLKFSVRKNPETGNKEIIWLK